MSRGHFVTAPDTENRCDQHNDRGVFVALEIIHDPSLLSKDNLAVSFPQ